LKKAWVGVRWVARHGCIAAIKFLANTANKLCQAGIWLARKALGGAQTVLNVAQKLVNNVKALVNTILDKVTNVVKMLSTFIINFVGFATNGFTGGDFGFIAKLTMNGTPREYKFNYNMKSGNLLKLATKIFTESIKKAFDKAFAWIKAQIKKLFSFHEVEDLEELEDMDDDARAAASRDSISLEEFTTATFDRSTALAQGSVKKKLTQVLVNMNGRDYLMKTKASSLAELEQNALSRPMDNKNAHFHLWKQAQGGVEDLERTVRISSRPEPHCGALKEC